MDFTQLHIHNKNLFFFVRLSVFIILFNIYIYQTINSFLYFQMLFSTFSCFFLCIQCGSFQKHIKIKFSTLTKYIIELLQIIQIQYIYIHVPPQIYIFCIRKKKCIATITKTYKTYLCTECIKRYQLRNNIAADLLMHIKFIIYIKSL